MLLSRTQKSRLCLSGGLKLALRKAQYLSRLAGAGLEMFQRGKRRVMRRPSA